MTQDALALVLHSNRGPVAMQHATFYDPVLWINLPNSVLIHVLMIPQNCAIHNTCTGTNDPEPEPETLINYSRSSHK